MQIGQKREHPRKGGRNLEKAARILFVGAEGVSALLILV